MSATKTKADPDFGVEVIYGAVNETLIHRIICCDNVCVCGEPRLYSL